jgi:hypothetical protein
MLIIILPRVRNSEKLEKSSGATVNHLNSLYQQVLLSISQVKVGRPPKVSDLQIACLYVLSYSTNTPVFNLAKILIDPSIQPYQLFRKYRTVRVYRLLELYRRRVNLLILILSILSGEEIRLILGSPYQLSRSEVCKDKVSKEFVV